MMISLFDLIWIEIIAVTTAGSIAYCLVVGKQNVQQELSELKDQVEHQRSRKKFWKAKAKGRTPDDAQKKQISTISMPPRSISIPGATGSGH